MAEQRLWAPWRMTYINKLGDDTPVPGKDEGCFLCDASDPALKEQDFEKMLVLLRDERGVLMLNRYPYTNGHLLASPQDHVGDISDLSAGQRAGLIELCEFGSRLLRQTMNPQGINIGMYLGRCAGAGLPGHAHMHVVPRWNGDVNFMQTIGEVRVIPQALGESYHLLKRALPGVK